jgi:hypothetical protein
VLHAGHAICNQSHVHELGNWGPNERLSKSPHWSSEQRGCEAWIPTGLHPIIPCIANRIFWGLLLLQLGPGCDEAKLAAVAAATRGGQGEWIHCRHAQVSVERTSGLNGNGFARGARACREHPCAHWLLWSCWVAQVSRFVDLQCNAKPRWQGVPPADRRGALPLPVQVSQPPVRQ